MATGRGRPLIPEQGFNRSFVMFLSYIVVLIIYNVDLMDFYLIFSSKKKLW